VIPAINPRDWDSLHGIPAERALDLAKRTGSIRAAWLHEIAKCVWGEDHPNLVRAYSYDELLRSVRELKQRADKEGTTE